jgi:hypothetical protein
MGWTAQRGQWICAWLAVSVADGIGGRFAARRYFNGIACSVVEPLGLGFQLALQPLQPRQPLQPPQPRQ